MSYTPDNQLLELPLLNAISAIEELRKPISERINHPDEWKDDHIEELRQLLIDCIGFESRLRKLSVQVR
jgi:hypothetical protein